MRGDASNLRSGAQPLAGELLYSLGKLALANYEFHSKTDNLEFMRAATLFQCALAVNPQHEKSANELAVIKAKEGDWLTARHFLQQAVVQRPDFLEAWQNLTKVHQRMGEPELAQLAAAQVEFLSQSLEEQGPVRMVSNAEFAATAAAMDGNEEMVSQPPRATPNDNSGKRPRLFPALQE
jgi:tetratricopeptide (TPR) repeat protein